MKADVERRFCLKEQERLYDGIEYLDMIKGGAFSRSVFNLYMESKAVKLVRGI